MADSSYNKGEEALLNVILNVLRPLCRQIIVCDTAPGLTRARHGVESVKASQWRLITILRTLATADIVVWAGGHMAQDISSQWSILGRLWLPILAKLLGRRVLIYAVDIGPLRTKFGRWLSRQFFVRQLEPADLLIVRNRESLNLLTKLGLPPERAQRVPDAALACHLADADAAAAIVAPAGAGRPIIAIAPRAAFYMKSGLIPATVRLRLFGPGRDVRRKTDALEASLARTIDLLADDMNAFIVLVPMDTGPNPRDDVLCANIAARVQHRDCLALPGTTHTELDTATTLSLMGAAELVVSGRFHGCVFALNRGTPVVPVDTGQDKITRLMSMFGYARPILTLHDLANDPSGQRLYGEIQALWRQRAREQARIQKLVTGFRREWDDTADLVRQALTGDPEA